MLERMNETRRLVLVVGVKELRCSVAGAGRQEVGRRNSSPCWGVSAGLGAVAW
jgi:hypothetical protein